MSKKDMLMACAMGNVEKVHELIAADKDLLNAKEPQKGATAIHFAIAKGQIDVVQVLIDAGADINAQSASGDSPLHVAVLKERDNIATLLIKAKCNTKLKNNNGKTAGDLIKARSKAKKKGKGKSKSKSKSKSVEKAAPKSEPTPAARAPPAEESGPAGGDDSDSEEFDIMAVWRARKPKPVATPWRPFTAAPVVVNDVVLVPGGPAGGASTSHHFDRDDAGPVVSTSPFPTTSRNDRCPESVIALRKEFQNKVVVCSDGAHRDSTAEQVTLKILGPNGASSAIRVPADYTGQELLDAYGEKFSSADLFELVADGVPIDRNKAISEQKLQRSKVELRVKYFKLPADLRQDSQLLEIMYAQVRNAVIDGTMVVTESMATRLAALQLQIAYCNFSRKSQPIGFITDESLATLMPEYLRHRFSTGYWEKRIINRFKKCKDMVTEQAMDVYLKVAQRAPTFGATLYSAKRIPGAVKCTVAVVQDGLMAAPEHGRFEFYSFSRRTGGRLTPQLKGWRVLDDPDGRVEVDRLPAGETQTETVTFVCKGKEAAQRLAHRLSAYYLLMIYGDNDATRPLELVEDFPFPVDPLPLRTVFQTPLARVPDRGGSSQIDVFMNVYVRRSIEAGVDTIPTIFPSLTEAADSERSGELLDLHGEKWTATQLGVLVDALEEALATDVPEMDLNLSTINIKGAKIGSSRAQPPEKVVAVSRLLHVVGDKCVVLSIDLSDNMLSKDTHWTELKGSLERCKPLENLNASNNGMGYNCFIACIRACESEGIPHVKTLTLAGNELDDKAAVAVGGLLSGRAALTSLNLRGNQITDHGITPLLRSLGQNYKLKEINLGENAFTAHGSAEICEFVAKRRTLTTVALPNSHITAQEMGSFAKRMAGNSTLKVLDLTGNAVGRGLEQLAQELANNAAMTSLNLSECSLEKHGITALLENIPRTQLLKTLILRSSGIGNDQAKLLLHAVKSNISLTHLDLSDNHLKGSFAAMIAPELSSNVRLEHLNIAHNRFGTGEGKELGEVIAKCSITSLDISHNSIGKGMLQIGKALEGSRKLKVLKAHSVGMQESHVLSFLELLEENEGLVEADFSDPEGHLKFKEKEWADALNGKRIEAEVAVTIV